MSHNLIATLALAAGLASAVPAAAQTVICAAASRTFNLATPVFPYNIDNTDSPILQLVEGNTYIFNCSLVPNFHPVFLTQDSDGGFGTSDIGTGAVNGYTAGDTCGSCARTTFSISPTTTGLMSFYYQCHIHSTLGNRIDILARPTIDTPPASVSVGLGATAMLSVAASTPNNATLTYQWRRAGTPINGATSATLTVNNVQEDDAVAYDCIVSNFCATTTTSAGSIALKCGLGDVAGFGSTPGSDGRVTVDDIVFYLAAFFGNNTAVADLTNLGGSGGPDGATTVDDLVLFLASFFAGC
ncbi:MAG: GC-type dockerin domain-anchored protein [Phycisphaerales bacterium]